MNQSINQLLQYIRLFLFEMVLKSKRLKHQMCVELV